MVDYPNSSCGNCKKHSEHKTRLYCLKVAEEEVFDIFRILDVPMNEQDILVRTINKENTCWYNLKILLDALVRDK